MTEIEIKDEIKQHLQEEITDYEAEDFPVDIYAYRPTNPKGALLIKSLGEIDTYIRNSQMDPGEFHPFVAIEQRWGIMLIVRENRDINVIYDLTERVKTALKGYSPDKKYKIYFQTSDEPGYDPERQVLYRSLIFMMPGNDWIEP